MEPPSFAALACRIGSSAVGTRRNVGIAPWGIRLQDNESLGRCIDVRPEEVTAVGAGRAHHLIQRYG